MENFKKNNCQQGISLIITFFIMAIILAVVLAISTILYSQIKIIRDIGNSVISFYAADSGVEKVLYYDRQVLPTLANGKTAVRGLCSMTLYSPTNPNACQTQTGANNPVLDSGIFCNSHVDSNGDSTPKAGAADTSGKGCDPSVCDDCTISFSTTFPDTKKSYVVNATIVPSATDKTSSDLTLDSTGEYENLVSRKIELTLTKTSAEDVIAISDASVVPDSQADKEDIGISAYVISTYGVSSVIAYIKTSPDAIDDPLSSIQLYSSSDPETPNADTYTGNWTGSVGTYYVDIVASDIKSPANVATDLDIQPYQ